MSKQWVWHYINNEDIIANEEFGDAVARYLNEKKITDFRVLYFDDNEQVCEIISFER